LRSIKEGLKILKSNLIIISHEILFISFTQLFISFTQLFITFPLPQVVDKKGLTHRDCQQFKNFELALSISVLWPQSKKQSKEKEPKGKRRHSRDKSSESCASGIKVVTEGSGTTHWDQQKFDTALLQ
jgi:hypothetical protein